MKAETHDRSMIRVEDLKKSFGRQKVLSGVGLSVDPGQTVTVLGRSGTGKSVLLKLLIGLQKPDSGSIWLDGKEVTKLSLDDLNVVRKRVGFLFQNAALYDSLTVEENVAFPMRRHSDAAEGEIKKRVRELLANVDMKDDLSKLPSDISGGMRKRVGLARALALDPTILLFDEPTSGLDPITASEIGELIVKLKKERGMTSVVVTHDIRGAKSFSDCFVVIDEGRVVAQGTFEELQQSKEPFVVDYLKRVA
jgi:phospholipid/cholesterol/gamma-HCH transport system ATP-binding protein